MGRIDSFRRLMDNKTDTCCAYFNMINGKEYKFTQRDKRNTMARRLFNKKYSELIECELNLLKALEKFNEKTDKT